MFHTSINQYEQISSDLFNIQSDLVYHRYRCYTESTNHAYVNMYNRKVDVSPETVSETRKQIENPCTYT